MNDDEKIYSDHKKSRKHRNRRRKKAHRRPSKNYTTYSSNRSDNFEIHENSDKSSPHRVDMRLKKKKNKKNKPRIRHDHFDRKLSGPTAQRGAIEQEFLTYFSKDAKGNFRIFGILLFLE